MRFPVNFIRRHKDLLRFAAGLLGSCLFALVVVLEAGKLYEDKHNYFEGESIRCILDFGQYQIKDDVLWAGLSYEMLQDFASENGCKVRIESYTKRQHSLDSLRCGSADIVLLPRFDSTRHVTHIDSVQKSRPVCKEVCWVMRIDDRARMKQVNHWIGEYAARDSFPDLVDRFRAMHSSSRPPKIFSEQKRLSPYDDIIRFYADSIGWDWRMLAAVIYTESKFAINVTSNVGAKGLMQLMPLTVRVYGVENPLDPKENIRAGAAYLGRLTKLLRRYASSQDLLYEYVFAAYNAGETRVIRGLRGAAAPSVAAATSPSDTTEENAADSTTVIVLSPADSAAIMTSSADSTVTAKLEEKVDSAIVAELAPEAEANQKPGGKQTEDYIKRIFQVYSNFCRICPK